VTSRPITVAPHIPFRILPSAFRTPQFRILPIAYFGRINAVFVAATVPLCLTNKVGCSVLMQPATYSWEITIIHFSTLSHGLKKLFI